jgi:hypothetical protein
MVAVLLAVVNVSLQQWQQRVAVMNNGEGGWAGEDGDESPEIFLTTA